MADYKKADYWQLKARQEGYPARSVYKLQEMDAKFGLVKSAAAQRSCLPVLDLGAAPGSWSLYLLRNKPGLTLVAADLSPLSREHDGGLFDGGNFCFIQGDFTEAAIRERIAAQGPYSLIISDAAPPTTGNRFIDTSCSLELAEAVLAYATPPGGGAPSSDGECCLAAKGNLLIKVFQGGDTSALLKRMKTLFSTAKSYKPAACRSDSFEVYYLGIEKLPKH